MPPCKILRRINMNLFTRAFRLIGKGGSGATLLLKIGALGALIVTLVLAGCDPVPPINILIPASANLQRRIVPGGILLYWDAPTGGNIGGFNVYNGVDTAELNGAPLNAGTRSYVVTGLPVGSVYAFELEIIFNQSDGGRIAQRTPSPPDSVRQSASRQRDQSVGGEHPRGVAEHCRPRK